MREHPLKPSKSALIGEALSRYRISSILDLGGCWGVNGGYTFHACDRGALKRAVIVDGRITNLTRDRSKRYPQVELIEGALGDRCIVEQVGEVDAIIMYDILLHQVAPNWDDFLSMWAARAKYLIVYNQNWTKDPTVVRFNQRELEWYLKNVPYTNEANIRMWYSKFDEDNREIGRKWRDVHIFWQFGIPPVALHQHIESQGFRVDHQFSDGPWSARYPWVVNNGLLASRVQNEPNLGKSKVESNVQ